MQPATTAVLVAWIAMLQLAVAIPLANLGTVRSGEGSATRAGNPHPGVIHSTEQYAPRDVSQGAVTLYEPMPVRSLQADEGTIEARFTLAHDGEHWVVVPPIARRTDSDSTRYEQVGRDLVSGEEDLALRDVARSENVALVGRAFSKLQCFTAIMTLSWGNDDGCSKHPKKATKLKISEVSTKRDVPESESKPQLEERALVEQPKEETGLVPILKRGYSNLACFTWVMTLSLGNDAGCSKHAKKATKLKISEVSTKRDLLGLPQDDTDLATRRAVMPEDNLTGELGGHSEALDERDAPAGLEKVSANQNQTNRNDHVRRDTEAWELHQYGVRSTDAGSKAAQERSDLWAGLERTAKCIQAISSLFLWKPYRDGCVYNKPFYKREIERSPLAQRPYQERLVHSNSPAVNFARHEDVVKRNAPAAPRVGLVEEPNLEKRRSVVDWLNKGANCLLAYGLTFGVVPIYNEGCKRTKRDLAAVQEVRRNIEDQEEFSRSLTAQIQKRSSPDAAPLFHFGQEKAIVERRNDIEVWNRKRGVAGCVMFITTMMGDWNSCRSRSARRKKAFKRPFKKAYDHIKYLY